MLFNAYSFESPVFISTMLDKLVGRKVREAFFTRKETAPF